MRLYLVANEDADYSHIERLRDYYANKGHHIINPNAMPSIAGLKTCAGICIIRDGKTWKPDTACKEAMDYANRTGLMVLMEDISCSH